MGGSDLDIYKYRLVELLDEAKIHLSRLSRAIERLQEKYEFPLNANSFSQLLQDEDAIMFADQTIYRFSKAQDVMGAKIFKAFMQYQGEDVEIPFRDMVNRLEKFRLLNADEWFSLREIRNNITHEYSGESEKAMNILNDICEHLGEMRKILENFANKI